MITQNSAQGFLNNYLVENGVNPESIEIASRLYDLDLGVQLDRNDGDPGLYIKQYGGEPVLIDEVGADPNPDTGWFDSDIRPMTVEEALLQEGVINQHRQKWGGLGVNNTPSSYMRDPYNPSDPIPTSLAIPSPVNRRRVYP